MKIMKQKLIAGLLSMVLVISSISPIGFQVLASELETEQQEIKSEKGKEAENSITETDALVNISTEDISVIEEVSDTEEDETTNTEIELQNEEDKKSTETQEESIELEETTESEESEIESETKESEIESETKESETEYENKTDLQEKVVKEELAGVYQFGDFPTDDDGITAYLVNLATDTNISELEKYLYQQMKERNETIDVESYQISTEAMGKIVTGVLNENPDLYFVNKSFQYTYYPGDTLAIEVLLTYDNSHDDNAFQKATKEALAVVKSGMSDLEKAIALHDYLAVNCEYDKENYDNDTIPADSYTAYGVLVNRVAVCQGYALAYKYLLNQIGIDCYMVSSKSMNHAWNLIVLNGKYYQIDVTWDDPTWDRIGRARHKYMFRSDNAFINECEHKDWSVTDGSEIVDYKATDTSYDKAFWLNSDSPLVLVGEDCYYVSYDKDRTIGVINKTVFNDITNNGTTICDIGKWLVWGDSSRYYTNAFSGLFQANNRLYFNDKTTIYSIDLNNIESGVSKKTEFIADTTDGYIYGSAFCQGKVLYSLLQTPNGSSKETVLTADITIEVEEPSEIPVEQIRLDKKKLHLVVGDTATLKATITPDNTTDVNITWQSSDDSIATVENGIVTAVDLGSCSITASVGGKEAVCKVMVTETEDDIACGRYKDIKWVLDTDNHLIVTGTGDFAEPATGNEEIDMKRAPWSDYFVASVEVQVTGMTDASYMFYECASMISVDVSGLDTENITNMSYMFGACYELAYLDLSRFNTKNVTNMSHMFSCCGDLQKLNISSFNTENVTDMSYMFEQCYSLSSLDLSSFNMNNVTDFSDIFSECNNLTKVYTPYNLEQSVILPNQEGIWYQADGTQIVELPKNLSYSTIIMKDEIPAIESPYLMITKEKTTYECGDILNIDDLTVKLFGTDGRITEVTGYSTNKESIDMSTMGKKRLVITYNDMKANVDIVVTIKKSEMISGGSYKDIVWAINTDGKLIVVGTGDFASSYSEDFGEDFGEIDEEFLYTRAPWYNARKSIVSAEVSVTGMGNASYMFYGCSNLTSLDFSKFNMKYITNMNGMFYGCSSLKSLDFSSFEVNSVSHINDMFKDCSALEELNLSSFNLRYVHGLDDEGEEIEIILFEGCTNLNVIYTPFNLTKSIELPVSASEDIWYQSNGKEITELPRNLEYSIVISKNKVSSILDSYIVVKKVQTDYECEDVLNMDDLTVIYYSKDGTVKKVTDYKTNKKEIDMSTPGKKVLKVTYDDKEASIELNVTPRTVGEDIASGSYKDITWVIDSKGKLTVTGTGDFAEPSKDLAYDHGSTDNSRAPWHDYRKFIESAEVNVTGMTDASYMFDECTSLKCIDLSGLDTKNITSMGGMFCRCENLTDLDVSDFDTSNVTDMGAMFYRCFGLTSIDVSGFDTGKVTSMGSMFGECYDLKTLDLSNFNTAKVTSMGSMFWDCHNLKRLDLSSFDTKNVTSMSWMFLGCVVENLDLSNFDTSNVKYMKWMFGNSGSILDISNFDFRNVVDGENIFCSANCSINKIYSPKNLTRQIPLPMYNVDDIWYKPDGTEITELPQNLDYSIIISRNDIPTISLSYIKANKTKTTYECGEILNIDDLKVRFFDTDGTIKEVTDFITNKDNIDMSTLGEKELKITYNGLDAAIKIIVIQATVSEDIASGSYENIIWVIDGTGKLIVTGSGDFAESLTDKNDRSPWYEHRTSITSAEINVTDMTDASYMFYECENLIHLDLSRFDTSKVTNMSYMFWDCMRMESLDVSNFNTSNVVNMCGMFGGASESRSLTRLDLSSFDTSKVTNMRDMFYWCGGLTYLDVSSFNTSNVTSMSGMFEGCWNLEQLDLSNFDTRRVRYMEGMFFYSRSLIRLDLTSFDTGKVTSMDYMFSECHSLTSVDLSSFDTRNVDDMSYMFYGCENLINLDLSGFNTEKVKNMYGMFSRCSSLTSLNISSFNTININLNSGSWDVFRFDDCTSLTTIYTPYMVSQTISLPTASQEDIWYQPDGTAITELPKNLGYSIVISKNMIPTITPHITAHKSRTIYGCGDILNVDDLTVRYYNADGTIKIVTDYTTNVDKIDMSTLGTKTLIVTYNGFTAEISIIVQEGFTVTFDLGGHGTPIAPLTGVPAGSLIDFPGYPSADGYEFLGWYKDTAFTEEWDFESDMIQENTTIYAYWHFVGNIIVPSYTKSGNLLIQNIPTPIYTGSAIKPAMTVYYQTTSGKTLLKAGTDYTIEYFNNIQADTEQEKTLGGTSQTDTGNGFTKDLAYIVITCKGNYTGTVYHNFHINPHSITYDGQNPAKDFSLTYTDQFIMSNKVLNPFRSIKYKKAMKVGKDYTIKITALKAFDGNKSIIPEGTSINGNTNSEIPAIPAGYQGTFQMTVTGVNNYQGTINKIIYVTDKNHLLKNAAIALGKNQKNQKYTGNAIALTPAWFDASAKKYYVIDDNGTRTEADKSNVFTVKIGSQYLEYGKDYTISYENNQAVGKATMTITGIGDYIGTKNITFRITGTAFQSKNISVDNINPSLVYTGHALTQNEVSLTDISNASPKKLEKGTDYTIAYKNNLKKGTATMTFTANPSSGYSGSFKKTFKITAAGLGDIVTVNAVDTSQDAVTTANGSMKLDANIIYTKEGAKPSNKIMLVNRNNNAILKEGTDYTVSYTNHKSVTVGNNFAIMTIKGKGNYNGKIIVSFSILKAPLTENENLDMTASMMMYSAKKMDDFQYQPKIKITDKKKVLSAVKDYEVIGYKNCTQTAVKTYLESLAKGTATADIRPYAIVEAREGSCYEGKIEVDLTIYQTKLCAKNLYIIVSSDNAQTTYTGKQVKPEVTVYYGEEEAIQRAKAAEETKENSLTNPSGSYRLAKLNSKENGIGDYTISYGTNMKAGKNKGSITIHGTGLYGGKATVKFTILGKNVYDDK